MVADKILLSSKIFPAVNDELISGGVAVKGNKILAVGGRGDILSMADANTLVEDFGDGLIIPGFCDAHVHFLMGCLFGCEADLSACKSEEEAAWMVKDFYDKKENKTAGEWVIGFMWYNFCWRNKAYPTKASLDKYFPDQPVFLLNADGHAGWVNSRALKIAGVDKNTPDPPYGQIYRDQNGEPTGFMLEEAMAFFVKYAFSFAEDKETALIKKALPDFNAVGITSVNDMQNFFGKDMGNVAVYQQLAERSELTLRINFATALLKDPEYSQSLKERFGDHEKLVCYNGGKEFMDGIINTHTSIMLDKYTDMPEAPTSFQLMDFDKAALNIKALQKRGLNIHLHATGDGAVRKAIDFYEDAVRENGFTKSRLSIEHLDLTDPADLPRLGKYGIIASVQPDHIALSERFADSEYPPTVGPVREKQLWSFRSMLENGAVLAFGTDYPLVPLDPLLGIYHAVTRLFPDGEPKGGWNPQEKLSLATSIRAYTYGGAYKCGKEDVLGTLTPGKLADITVLDKNLFELEPSEYLNCRTRLTMLNGQVVYRGK